MSACVFSSVLGFGGVATSGMFPSFPKKPEDVGLINRLDEELSRLQYSRKDLRDSGSVQEVNKETSVLETRRDSLISTGVYERKGDYETQRARSEKNSLYQILAGSGATILGLLGFMYKGHRNLIRPYI